MLHLKNVIFDSIIIVFGTVVSNVAAQQEGLRSNPGTQVSPPKFTDMGHSGSVCSEGKTTEFYLSCIKHPGLLFLCLKCLSGLREVNGRWGFSCRL